MKETWIIAIDPGATGGVVELYPDGRAAAFSMMEDAELRDHVEGFFSAARMNDSRIVAFVELVGGYIGGSKFPGSAMFNFGDGYGYIRGLIDAARVERRMVRPQDWQAGIPGVKGKEKADRKRALKAHAARLFPSLKVTLKTADALCIADYGRRWLALPQQSQLL